MAQIGPSNQLIRAITCHVTDSEVNRYTRDAEQQRMAELAMESLASSWENPTFSTPEGENGAPERIRTSDPQIRSLVLYPAELRARLEGAT